MKKSSSTTTTKKPKKVATPKLAKVTRVKKSATTTKKTTASKKQATKPTLRVAEPAKAFWTNDGKIISHLGELAESFAAMDEILFRYHAQAEFNHFAEWVEQVLEDAACAAALRKVKTARGARTVVIRHLQNYE